MEKRSRKRAARLHVCRRRPGHGGRYREVEITGAASARTSRKPVKRAWIGGEAEEADWEPSHHGEQYEAATILS